MPRFNKRGNRIRASDKSKVVITNIRIFVRTTVERIEVKK